MDDYFRMNPEFRDWLKDSKRIISSDISTEESKKYFKKFINRWNKGKLKSRYYKSSEIPFIGATTRTSHQWEFKGIDNSTLKKVKIDVEKQTSKGMVKDEDIGWSSSLLPLNKL